MKNSTKTISLKDFLDNFTDIEDLNYQNIVVEFTEENKDEIYKWLKEVAQCNHMNRWENCILGNHMFYIANCDLQYIPINVNFKTNWLFDGLKDFDFIKVV